MSEVADKLFADYETLSSKVASIIGECSTEDELRKKLTEAGVTYYKVEWVSTEESADEGNLPTFDIFSYSKAKSGNWVKVQLEKNPQF